jgi:hypothetical protein
MLCPVGSDSLTAAEVAEWFPDSVYGRPTPEECSDLLMDINDEVKKEVWIKAQRPKAKRLINHYQEAAKLARVLEKELTAVINLSGRDGGITTPRREVWALLTTVDEFLRCTSVRRVGAPTADWPHLAAKWAQRVAKIIAKPGKLPPSLSSDSGPVTAVVSKILHHCYGMDIHRTQVGRRLRDLKARQKSRLDTA